MKVCFLTVSYAAVLRKIFHDDCQIPVSQRTTITSSILIYCTSICTTVRRSITLIYSALGQEGSWIEEEHAWVLIVELIILRWGRSVFTYISLAMLLEDTLKASHDSIKMEFMWWGNICVVPYFSNQANVASLQWDLCLAFGLISLFWPFP